MHVSIRIKGHLDPSWQQGLGALQIVHEENGASLLTGVLMDQAALFGVLKRIDHLSLTLLSLESGAHKEQDWRSFCESLALYCLYLRHLSLKGKAKDMNQVDERKRPGILRIGIIVLTVFTAAYHLYLSISLFGLISTGATPEGATPEGLWMFAILFLLNCIGYLFLVYALYQRRFQRFHRLTRWLLIGYTALTILLWYLMASSVASLPDYSDKAAEALLIVLLLIEGWRTQRSSSLVAFP